MLEIAAILALAAALAVIGYLAEHIGRITERRHAELISFAAGILAAVIFMRFLPLLQVGVGLFGFVIYIVALIGFIAYHIAEEWLYQHSGPAVRRRVLSTWHGVGFFTDHLILGLALALLWLLGYLWLAVAVALPFALYVATAAHDVLRIRQQLRFGVVDEILLAVAPLIGAVIGIVFAYIQPVILYAVFAYVVGSLLYLVSRDVIPKEREAQPLWFAAGALLTAALLLL